MPASEKQIRANRANALKSTGPKTTEGKQIVGRNAVKHGLYSDDIIINSPALTEDREEYERILESLLTELRPDGVFQEHLIRKIANCLWRSRRVLRAETAHVSRQLASVDKDLAFAARLGKLMTDNDAAKKVESPEELQNDRAMAINTRCIPTPDISPHLLRHETRLDRQLTRALNLLERVKKFQSIARNEAVDVGPLKNEQTNPILPTIDNDIQLCDK